MSFKFNGRQSLWISFGVLVIGILLRFILLDADPYYYEWAGYITDEGLWVANARSLALFGELLEEHIGLHLWLAPLFQLANYIIFELAGVSVLTSRIFTALCGSAILVLFWIILRRVATRQTVLLGLTLLACQTDLVALSRVAVPEIAVMFFQLFIYYLIVTSNGESLHRMFLSGFFLFLAMGMKLTSVSFLVIFSAIIFFMPRQNSSKEIWKQAWLDLLSFLSGVATPILGLMIIWFMFTGIPKNLPFWVLDVLKDHIRLSNMYGTISLFFESHFFSTLNTWALGLWLSLIGWMSVDRHGIDFQSRRYLVTSIIWITLYFSLMLILVYFPTRYKVHILIPMAVSMVVGISLLQRVTIRKVLEAFVKARGLSRLLRMAILSFPTAVFISPLLALPVILSDADPGRLRIKLSCLIISFGVTIYAAYRLKDRKHAIAFFLTFPLIGAMALLILNTFGATNFPFYANADTQYHAVWWSLFLLGVSVISIPIAKSIIGLEQVGIARCVLSFAITYLVISLVTLSPGYIDPHYSIKNVSINLGKIYSNRNHVFTYGADGLFNNNSLRYRRMDHTLQGSETGDIVVVAFAHRKHLENSLEKNAQLLYSYDLYISPEYYRLHPHTELTFPRNKIVRVFKIK